MIQYKYAIISKNNKTRSISGNKTRSIANRYLFTQKYKMILKAVCNYFLLKLKSAKCCPLSTYN